MDQEILDKVEKLRAIFPSEAGEIRKNDLIALGRFLGFHLVAGDTLTFTWTGGCIVRTGQGEFDPWDQKADAAE